MCKFMQILLKVDKIIMKHFVIVAETKRGATATITITVPVLD